MKQVACLLASVVLLLPLQVAAQQIVGPTTTPANPGRSPSPPGASLEFSNLKDGDVVPKSFSVRFRITGMRVRPAGTMADNSGHHHLLIDIDKLPPMDQPLPSNESVYHFGKGQKSAVITLPPGKHTLQLLFADYRHVPHDPPVMSEKITITVEGDQK